MHLTLYRMSPLFYNLMMRDLEHVKTELPLFLEFGAMLLAADFSQEAFAPKNCLNIFNINLSLEQSRQRF
jgi:hypothetical protein